MSSSETLEKLTSAEREALYGQSTVPGIDLVGGHRLVAGVDVSRYTERGRTRAVASLVETWRRRLNTFGISEPVVAAREEGAFDIVVPLSADTGLAGRMIRESGEITLHLFKDGAEVQALRQRIDAAVLEKASPASGGPPGLVRLVRSVKVRAVRAWTVQATRPVRAPRQRPNRTDRKQSDRVV